MADDLDRLGLRPTLLTVLRREGVESCEHLASHSPAQLWELHDVGRASVQQIREALRRVGLRLAEGKLPRTGARKPPALRERCPTLGDFIDREYGPWSLAHHKQESAEANIARLRYSFGELLDERLVNLRRGVLDRWRARRLADVTAETCNRDTAALRAVLSRAVDWEIIDEHPMAKFRQLKVARNVVGREFSDDEAAALLRALEVAGEPRRRLRTMVVLTMWTGLRWGELARLEWRDFLRDRELLHVRAETAKASNERTIPLVGAGLHILQGWRLYQRSRGISVRGAAHIFPWKTERRPRPPRKAFRTIQARAGIEHPRRWHDLRHHFGSALSREGAPLMSIKTLCGHSSVKVTERYTHTKPDHLRAAVNRLGGADQAPEQSPDVARLEETLAEVGVSFDQAVAALKALAPALGALKLEETP